MMAARSALLSPDQAAISSNLRLQPRQSPEASIWQTPMQGVSGASATREHRQSVQRALQNIARCHGIDHRLAFGARGIRL